MPTPVYVSAAADCPALQVPAAILAPQDRTPTTAPASVAGHTTQLLDTLNELAAGLDSLGRHGSGAYAILAGLELSSSGGVLDYSAGLVSVDGNVGVDAGSLTPADNAYNWIWVTQTGAIVVASDAAAAPVPAVPTGGLVFAGRVLKAAGAITEIDYSGRWQVRNNTLWRRTNDSGEPADTPPSTSLHITQTTVGRYLWDGNGYTLLGAGQAGYVSIALSDADYTLSAGEQTKRILKFTGTLTVTRSITAPTGAGTEYVIHNATGQSLVIKTSGGTGPTIPAGEKVTVWSDGTDYQRTTDNSAAGSSLILQVEDATLIASLVTLDLGPGFDAVDEGSGEARVTLDLSEIITGDTTFAANVGTVVAIRGKGVPTPGAADDLKLLQYNHTTGALQWVAPGAASNTIAVEFGNVAFAAAIGTIDFDLGFVGTESPSGELNLGLDASAVFTGGDITWSTNVPTNTKLQGRAVPSPGAGDDGKALFYDFDTLQWLLQIPLAVEEAGTSKVANAKIIDFQAGFDVTESPTGRAQVALDGSEIFTGGDLGWSGNLPTVTGLRGHNLPAPGVGEDLKFIQWDNTSGAYVWNTAPASPATITVQFEDVTLSTVIDTIDFGLGFDGTVSPAGELNLTLDLSEILTGDASAAANVITVTGIRTRNVPTPGSTEDEHILVYDHGTTACVWRREQQRKSHNTFIAPSATANTYGTAITVSPSSGYQQLQGFVGALITGAGTFGGGETLTVRITANYLGGGTNSTEITGITSIVGTYYSTVQNCIELFSDTKIITSFSVDVKSSAASSAASVNVDVCCWQF